MTRFLLRLASAALLALLSLPAGAQQVPAPINAPSSVTSGHALCATASRQQAADCGAAPGDTITSPNGTLSVGGTSTNTTLDVVYGTAAHTAAQGNDSRITGALQGANNLSDLASASSARTNLGLGSIATAAAAAYAATANNLSDLANSFSAIANLGWNVNAPAASATDITLANPMAPVQQISFSAPGHRLILPAMNAGNSIPKGWLVRVNNVGAYAFAIYAQDGTTVLVSSLAAGDAVHFILTANSTANGSFNIRVYGSAGTYDASAFAQTANNLSDLASASSARTNLGLAASATTDTTNAANISSGTLPVGRLQNALFILGYSKGINVNSTGDTAITVSSPTSQWRVVALLVVGASGFSGGAGALKSGLYSATSQGGAAFVPQTANTIAAVGNDTLNAAQQMGGSQVIVSTDTTIYFNVGTALGAAGTVNVYVFGYPLP